MTPAARFNALTAWTKAQGAHIEGVELASLAERGIGVVATKPLKKGETIVSLPASAFITSDTDFVRKALVVNATVHGTVAAALTLNHESPDRPYQVWQAVWPSKEDIEQIMPLCWAPQELAALPPTAKVMLNQQKEQYDRDWAVIKPQIPGYLSGWYKYYWLIVNSRCFHWVYFTKAKEWARRGKSLPRSQCLALVPWADYFNHADQGCQVDENEDGAKVICDRDYQQGEEVVVSYGPHSNDYLLIEWGFMLDKNTYDCTTLDHIVLPMLGTTQRKLLERYGYRDSYHLSASGLCYRTHVAIRAMVTTLDRMQGFLEDEYDGRMEEREILSKWQEVLQELKHELHRTRRAIRCANIDSHVTSISKLRCEQLLTMVREGERGGKKARPKHSHVLQY